MTSATCCAARSTPRSTRRSASSGSATPRPRTSATCAGLLSTLTENCVYEIVGTEHVWRGHEGAARFYAGLLGGFPDIDFQLTDIVIGPQGVCEEADVTGTHARDWLDYEATGERVEFKVVIFFPWDPSARLFTGERIHVDLGR